MKKLFFTLVLFLFLLFACNNQEPHLDENTPLDFLDIYYINDLHGAIESSERSIGMASMGNFLLYQKDRYPDETIILAGGDMLQGSALSNASYGASVIEMMNAMNFDAFVIGNHEFDWGLEKVTRYFDHSDDHIAEFPLLGANVFYKGTETIPNGIDPYVIIERRDLRIGIIGTMEYGIEETIAHQHIKDYYFANPGPIVNDLTRYLREDEAVDIVILISHDRGNVNQQIIFNQEGEHVDVIFNGHSHQTYTRTENGIPVIQSGGYGSNIGHLRFELKNNVIEDFSMTNLNRDNEPRFSFKDLKIQTMIESFYEQLDDRYQIDLIPPERDFSRSELTLWLSKLLAESTNADIGLHNSGGTRQELYANQDFNLFIVYDIWPFDNEIVTFYLSGEELNQFLSQSQWNYYASVNTFQSDELYKVVTHDFIYYRESNAILRDGLDFTKTGVFLRDLAFDELVKQSSIYSAFDIDNPILTQPTYYDNIDEIQP